MGPRPSLALERTTKTGWSVDISPGHFWAQVSTVDYTVFHTPEVERTWQPSPVLGSVRNAGAILILQIRRENPIRKPESFPQDHKTSKYQNQNCNSYPLGSTALFFTASESSSSGEVGQGIAQMVEACLTCTV